MTIEEAINDMKLVMERKIESMPARVRLWTTEYTEYKLLPRNMILTGLRGVGKSTFLLYHAQHSDKKMLYFSADNPILSTVPLYTLVSSIFLQGYDGVIIDEVHFARDWSKHLKSLYDDYPDRMVWASDSSALILRNGTADMSRRYVFMHMPILSFREFLFLETGTVYDACNPSESPAQQLPLSPDATILAHFEQYKNHGTRPFYQEGNYEERSLAVLEKTIHADVPFFVPHVTDDNIRLMTAVVGTLAGAAVPRLQVRSLCADWSVSADKLYQLLEVMEAVGAVRIIRYPNDTKAKTAGAKLFLADSCLYAVLVGNGNVGTQREALVTALLQEAGFLVNASKDETKGDFVITKKAGIIPLADSAFTIEVGGKDKERKSSDFVIRDNIDYATNGIIPLWLLAMMW